MIEAGYAVFTIGSIGALALWRALRNHRIDIGTGQSSREGSAPIGAFNVLNPNNYDDRGRRLLWWVYCFTGLQIVGMGLLIGSV